MDYNEGKTSSQEQKASKPLKTVRIMGINIKKLDDYGLLVVSELEGDKKYLKKIRIYLHNDLWDMKGLSIANQYYLHLVKYREKLNKKVRDRHLYKTYNDVALLERNETTRFYGVRQLYLATIKNPNVVLKRPRANYREVKSDTLRLWLRDEILRNEKEKQLKEKENKGE